MTKETRILWMIAGGINWIIGLMAAFGSQDGWFQAGQFFFSGGFFLLIGFPSTTLSNSRYKKLAWVSLSLSMIFAVLNLMN